jgi:hypothetical protein
LLPLDFHSPVLDLRANREVRLGKEVAVGLVGIDEEVEILRPVVEGKVVARDVALHNLTVELARLVVAARELPPCRHPTVDVDVAVVARWVDIRIDGHWRPGRQDRSAERASRRRNCDEHGCDQRACAQPRENTPRSGAY